MPGILPLLQRRLAGATGGILQCSVFAEDLSADGLEPLLQRAYVDFLHRTVYDWLQNVRSEIVEDGPPNYHPGLRLTSVLVSRKKSLFYGPRVRLPDLHRLTFETARCCDDSPGSRAKLLRIVEQLKLSDQSSRDLLPGS